MHDLEIEKMALVSELDDKAMQYTDLQVTHTALSDKLAAEQQALVKMQQTGHQKLTEQQVLLSLMKAQCFGCHAWRSNTVTQANAYTSMMLVACCS